MQNQNEGKIFEEKSGGELSFSGKLEIAKIHHSMKLSIIGILILITISIISAFICNFIINITLSIISGIVGYYAITRIQTIEKYLRE